MPNCRISIRVDREVFRSDGTRESHDVRYFLTSLDPGKVTPHDLQDLVRDHWQVETSLHFVKDRWWEEDRHYLSRPGLGKVWTLMTNLAISVLRLVQNPSEPLTETAENFHYSPKKALQILGFNQS
jgi:Transposase DDE domain.